jgi:AraC-like DNA-binding protein
MHRWSSEGLNVEVEEGCRRTIHAGSCFRLEDSRLPASRPLGHGYSPDHQIVLPYHGAFGWQIGKRRRLIDANAILFVSGQEEFIETHPLGTVGHGSAIITPDAGLLDELCGSSGGVRAAFRSVSRPITDTVRLLTHQILFDGSLSSLAREEIVIRLLQALIDDRNGSAERPDKAAIETAKHMLQQAGDQPLSLDEIARSIGVSPVYLTQSFSRSEGMPLYRYQMRLRLSRALYELPRRSNLTYLALDLGFSSHSHFTSTFRSAFGITPSQFRARHVPNARAVAD